ncbi:MAG: hypothetical protein MI724_19400 [Spirochaetales bacterium]|nr:hypothetical protein [Spirochaetales bacterium]
MAGIQNYGDAPPYAFRSVAGRRGRSNETAGVRDREELRITNANSANLNNEVFYVLEYQFGQ